MEPSTSGNGIELAEALGERQRTLVLCFDGTAGQFDPDVRLPFSCHSPSLQPNQGRSLELQCRKVLQPAEEGPGRAVVLLPSWYRNVVQAWNRVAATSWGRDHHGLVLRLVSSSTNADSS